MHLCKNDSQIYPTCARPWPQDRSSNEKHTIQLCFVDSSGQTNTHVRPTLPRADDANSLCQANSGLVQHLSADGEGQEEKMDGEQREKRKEHADYSLRSCSCTCVWNLSCPTEYTVHTHNKAQPSGEVRLQLICMSIICQPKVIALLREVERLKE